MYPSSSAVTFDGSALNVALPSQYTFSKGETHALMQARINGYLLDFRHLAALFKVDVAGVPEGASLVVTAPQRKINGTYHAFGTDLTSAAGVAPYASETGRGAASPNASLNFMMNSYIVIILLVFYMFLSLSSLNIILYFGNTIFQNTKALTISRMPYAMRA